MLRFAIAALFLGWATVVPAAVWEIDPAHTSVQFSIRHMTVSNVRGEFSRVSGTVDGDETDPTHATIQASIDTASIDTRQPKRDEHLKSADFFDVEHYPTMTFRSKRIEAAGTGHYRVTGDLTLHGVTREVVLDVSGLTAPVKDPRGGLRSGAEATARINRKDFGLIWSKTLDGGGVMLGDEVAITIDVEAVKKD